MEAPVHDICAAVASAGTVSRGDSAYIFGKVSLCSSATDCMHASICIPWGHIQAVTREGRTHKLITPVFVSSSERASQSAAIFDFWLPCRSQSGSHKLSWTTASL